MKKTAYIKLPKLKEAYENVFHKPILYGKLLEFLQTKDSQLQFYNYNSDKENLANGLKSAGVDGVIILDIFESNNNNRILVFEGFNKKSFEAKYGTITTQETLFGLYLDPLDDKYINDLTNSETSFYRIILNSNGFMGFPARTGWLSPIEYYLNWKLDMVESLHKKINYVKTINIGPYELLNEQIKIYGQAWGYYDLLGIKSFYLDGKEKFGTWVVNGFYVLCEDGTTYKPLSFLANKATNDIDTERYKDFLKLVLILTEDFLLEYQFHLGMTEFENPEFFKKSIRKLILGQS